MKIDSIKTNLKSIALLANECKERISSYEDKEFEEITDATKQGHQITKYDKQFCKVILDNKKEIFDQIIYFAERIFIELARRKLDGKLVWGLSGQLFLDKEKFDDAIKMLTKEEAKLLESVRELIQGPKKLESNLETILQIGNRLAKIVNIEDPQHTTNTSLKTLQAKKQLKTV